MPPDTQQTYALPGCVPVNHSALLCSMHAQQCVAAHCSFPWGGAAANEQHRLSPAGSQHKTAGTGSPAGVPLQGLQLWHGRSKWYCGVVHKGSTNDCRDIGSMPDCVEMSRGMVVFISFLSFFFFCRPTSITHTGLFFSPLG